MPPRPLIERLRRLTPLLLSTGFVLLIFLPTLDSIFHLDHTPIPNEKRLMAPLPEFHGILRTGDYLAGFQRYFDDHFGFRKRLVATNNHWKRQLFRDAPNERVIVGNQGWLFSTSERMLDFYLGAARLSPQDLEAWRQLLEKRRDWLKRHLGAKYIFVIAPDKHSVYPEYLPKWLSHRAHPTPVEQFTEYMKAHSTVPVLDLRPALAKAKPLGVNYLKTDSHWNYLGAFYGYQALIRALGQEMPGLEPLPLTDFRVQPITIPAGDMADALGGGLVETQQVSFTPLPPLVPLSIAAEPSRLPKKWRKLTDPTVSDSTTGHGKAVIFRDSFASRWEPFLGYNFKEVLYIWQYYWDPAFLEREKPNVVIDEILERFFNTQDPRALMREDHLP